jgi:hypothetical protein
MKSQLINQLVLSIDSNYDYDSSNKVDSVPKLNITMTANGAYTAVNHKVTTVNGQYFTRLLTCCIRSKTTKNALKIEYSIVYDTTRYGRNTVDAKRAKYD